jgi:hypothetical protein
MVPEGVGAQGRLLVYHATYARLKVGASLPRLQELVSALESEACLVEVNFNNGWINVSIPDDKMWWVLTGCITVFFDDYKDVASWSFQFRPPERISA